VAYSVADSLGFAVTAVKCHQTKVLASNFLRSSFRTLNGMAQLGNNFLLWISVSSHCDKR